jgi:exopolysaccharide production protein ExoQ
MSRWYYWVSGFFLLDATQAFGFIDRLAYGNWMGKTGDKITQSLNLLMILTGLTLFIHSYRRGRGVGLGGALALATIAFLLLTALWSTDPGATVREGVVYLFIVVGAIGIAGSLDADEFMDLLGRTCFLAAIASLVLLVVSPGNALMEYSGDFIGVFSHKNFLGQVMVTGALASLHALRLGGRRRARNIFMLLTFAGMAFASKSATSWLTIFIFCCVDGIIALWRKGGVAQLVGGILTIVLMPALIFAVADPDPILDLIGKDPSLTGRTDIWAYVIDNISVKPLLGWGYFGFWLVSNPAAMDIAEAEGWFVPQAHNGLLEMLLNIGIVGTFIFLFLFARNVMLGFKCLWTPAKALAISTILSCSGIILLGISENVLLAPTQSSTTVFLITGLMCERAVWVAKRRQYRVAPRRYPRAVSVNSVSRISKVG